MQEFSVTTNNRTWREEKTRTCSYLHSYLNVFLEIAAPLLKTNGRSLIQKSGVLVMNSWKMKENFNDPWLGARAGRDMPFGGGPGYELV